MSSRMYTVISAIALCTLSQACLTKTSPIHAFSAHTPILTATRTTLHLSTSTQPKIAMKTTAIGHVEYFERLIGQNCEMKKWDELLLKAVRASGGGNSVRAPEEVFEPLWNDTLVAGDLVHFEARPNTPSYAVIVKRLERDTYKAITTTNGIIDYIRINPMHPKSRRINGTVANSFIRVIKPRDTVGGYLAGELIRSVSRPSR